jgi:hypothetical protein
MTMAKNVLPFRKPVPVAAQSTAREHGRVIFQIGGSRFALNFHVTVSEVNPVDAEILSIDKGLLGPQRARPQGEQHSVQAPELPIGEVVVRSDGLAPYLGSQSALHRGAKALRVLAPTSTTLG